MAMKITRALTATLFSLGLAQGVMAETLQGAVTDVSGEAGLEGAVVTIEELGRSTTTGRFGDYRFVGVPEGTYNLTVSYVGADTVTSEVSVDAPMVSANFTLGSDVRYLDNILVVGTSAAQAGAINQQRASNSILSVVDSDGLGNFPDVTVADTLSRVAGLSIETDQGEGRYVSIRGINTDLISASINGVRTPSPEDRRGVLLDGVPSDLLDGIEIQKSLTPDVDADTLGGVVNLKTISAFDRDGRFIRAKVEGRYNEISKEISPKATLTWSETFGDQFGAAVSLNYQNLAIEAHNNEAGGWGEEDGVFFIDDDYEQRWYDLTRERFGVVANFDFRPTENTDLYIRTLFNQYTDDEVRNKFEFKDLDDAEDGEILSNGTVVPLNEVDAEVRQREEVRQIQTISAGGETIYDAWTFSYEASYAFAEEDDSDNHDAKFRFEDIQDDFEGALLNIDTSSGETPRLSGSALGLALDPTNYVLDEFEEEFSTNEDEEIALRFDVSRESFLFDTPVEWKAGVKFRDREKTRDVNKDLYSGDLGLADFTRGFRVTDWRLPNPMARFPDPDLTAALRGGQSGLEFEDGDSAFESLAEDYIVEEQILATYAMGTFEFDKLTLVAGLRYEQTDTDLTGNVFVEGDDAGDEVARSLSKDYDHLLPSINAKYEFNDQWIGRAAYYASVVRPGFAEAAPAIVLTEFGPEDEAETELLGNPTLEPLEANNFDLSIEFYPTKLSLISGGIFYKSIENAIYETSEFSGVEAVELGILDPALVPDELIDGIFEEEDVIIDGEEETIITNNELNEVTTFINVDEVDLFGIELNYVQELSFLGENFDGFLVSANATFTESEATLPTGRDVPFLKQSDTVWNIAVGYDKGPWDVRVSANYRGDYLDELVGENLDRYTDDRLLVEASAKYDVNDQVQVYLEGKNLTDEPEYYYFGDESRLSQYDEFGTTIILGARFTY